VSVGASRRPLSRSMRKRTADVALLREDASRALQSALGCRVRRRFFTTPGYDGWPLVVLRLAQVDVEQLAELVTGSWRTRAQPAQASELGKTGGRPDLQPG
jgi:hypothetical protein